MFNVKDYLFKVSPVENRAKFALLVIFLLLYLRSSPRYEFRSHAPSFKISEHQKKYVLV